MSSLGDWVSGRQSADSANYHCGLSTRQSSRVMAQSLGSRRKKWKKTKPYNSPKPEDVKLVTGSWKVRGEGREEAINGCRNGLSCVCTG